MPRARVEHLPLLSRLVRYLEISANSPTDPSIAGPAVAVAAVAPAPPPPVAVPAAVVPAGGWREPALARDDLLVLPVPGNARRGVPRGPSRAERQRSRAEWERGFDADLEWLRSRAGSSGDESGSGAGRTPLLEEIVVAPERAEGEVRRSERKRKRGE